jgi:hypothetical protein
LNRNAITPEARVPCRFSAYWNENSQEDDPILYLQYMPHCTVACHSISPSVNSGDPGNKILTRQERMMITVLAVYEDEIVHTT